MQETIKTRSGRVIIMPTPEEEAQINAGIAADPDTFELDDAWFARAKPASEFFSPEVYAQLCAMRQRGPKDKPLKVPTTIRFDADVLAVLRASGKGWQTRVNAAMRDWLSTHSAV
ncbi:BrnA antitoxin family protein [Rhodoferax sp.]|uniref:BrnA antitoxin family protein n=1 Tax=Rhodoferax sp. TaxID=50421 RepID=UPI002615861D|nr:BrnA antitoxin family protein [Rhodoferax sp.]MDD2808497.1 BrnA antitoxin family protein [Rhodoferax sp.]MDD4943841.1 BrnA antitoxin family protein [Rhodoferax sp.]